MVGNRMKKFLAVILVLVGASLAIPQQTQRNAAFDKLIVRSNFNSVLYVGGTVTGDIGAQINTAYAALPNTGGVIAVIPKADGSCYSYSTPIVANTSGKYLLLEGIGATNSISAPQFGGGACLNYTPTTATTAITLDYVPSNGGNQQSVHGIRDLTLWNNQCVTAGGCGSLATGISVPQVNGGVAGGVFDNLAVKGFSTGFIVSGAVNVSWGIDFRQSLFYYNATGFSNTNTGGLENIHFYGGRFLGNGTGMNTKGEVYAFALSYDGNLTTAVNLVNTGTSTPGPDYTCVGCHFENPSSSPAVPHYITGTANWVLIGGILENDNVGVSTWDFAVQAQGAYFSVQGTELVCNGGANTTLTAAVSTGANVRGHVEFINWNCPVPPTYVGGASAANVTNTSFNWNNSNAPQPWTIEANLKGPIGIGDTQFVPNVLTGLHLRFNGNSIDALRFEDYTNTHTMDCGPGIANAALFSCRDITNARQAFQYSFTSNVFAIPAITPLAAAGGDVGSAALPFANLWLGTAATNNAKLQPATMTAARVVEILDSDLAIGRGVVTSTYTNATTTASNITGLSFAVLANRNYTMRCDLYYQGSAGTAGLDITITGPASPTSIFYSYQETPTATTTQGSVASAFATKLVGNAAVTATTNLPAQITLGLRNGANAGTVQVQGSATGAGTVTVQAGSFCTMQ